MPTNSTAGLPPPSASPLYQRLHATSIEFLSSMEKDPSSPDLINHPRLIAVRTRDFLQYYGHHYLVSQTPAYHAPMNVEALVEHMQEAIPLMERWDVTVTDIIVDVEKKRTVVRSSYLMQAKGERKPVVEDDIVWFLHMDQDGGKVRMAVEFKDALADRKFAESMES